jgi:hypothetical protein
VITLEDLRPGDIGFVQHVLPRSADLFILAGQLALGEPGYPHHVFVVTDAAEAIPPAFGRSIAPNPYACGPKIVQAMPSGAEEIEIGEEFWTKDYTYIRPAYEDDEGWHVASCARRYVGTPYSFADYAAIAGVHFGIANGPIRRYVTSSKHQICSQLADQAMSDAGFHVFNDGRLPQDVTPSALFQKLLSLPGSIVIQP